MAHKNMNNAIAYTRVSTRRQGDNGVGLDAQLIAIEAYARGKGYKILTHERDVHTGKGDDGLEQRSGLRAAVRKARRAKCPIIVSDLSRLARNSSVVEQIIGEAKVHIISLGNGSSSCPIAMKAQAEKDQRIVEEISRRTKAALQDLKERGVQLGNRTNLHEAQKLGAKSKKRKADEFAAKVFPKILELDGKGFLSNNAIANELNRRGIPTAQTGKWTAASVGRLIARVGQSLPNRSRKKLGNPFDAAAMASNKLYGAW